MSGFNAKSDHHASTKAGIAAFISARDDAAMSSALDLDESNRILVIVTEGTTGADLYQRLLAS